MKRCLDQRGAERSYGVPDGLLTEVPWTLPALRRWWNASKEVLAPWWAQNSKEAYSSGLDALAGGLRQYSASRSGRRRGPKAGFPRFKSRHRSRVSCRFTTGAIRVGDGMHVVLPRIGRVKTHERTTALLARIDAGTARILAATVSFDGRRWHCAFTVEADREAGRPAHAGRDRAASGGRRRSRGAGPAGGRRTRWRRGRAGAGARSLARAQAQAAGVAAPRGPAGRPGPARGQAALASVAAQSATGSGASTPAPPISAGMFCTRPPRPWPSATR